MNEGKQHSEDAIRRRARRLQQMRERPGPSPLRGFGAFGVIGWSVALPTVAGILLGLWLERVAPQDFSWPLALMLGGLVIGVLVAWEWVAREAAAEAAEAARATAADSSTVERSSSQRQQAQEGGADD